MKKTFITINKNTLNTLQLLDHADFALLMEAFDAYLSGEDEDAHKLFEDNVELACIYWLVLDSGDIQLVSEE